MAVYASEYAGGGTLFINGSAQRNYKDFKNLCIRHFTYIKRVFICIHLMYAYYCSKFIALFSSITFIAIPKHNGSHFHQPNDSTSLRLEQSLADSLQPSLALWIINRAAASFRSKVATKVLVGRGDNARGKSILE